MKTFEAGALVGCRGLYCQARPGWTRVGAGAFGVNAILRTPQGLLLATEGGLWQVPAGTDQWVQWHDETLTLVLALADLGTNGVAAGAGDGTLGVLVGSAYGVATGRLDELGAARWQWHSSGLSPNERFTNDVLVDPGAPGRWLAATEAGVLLSEDGGGSWFHTSLRRTPVRCLGHTGGAYWAGADQGGAWRSEDGVTWSRAGSGLEDVPVFALAPAGDGFIAGTGRGVAHGDGGGAWTLTGPPLRVAAVAAYGGRWWAGASPGGLWHSDDAGETWRRTGDFQHVRALAPPEEE